MTSTLTATFDDLIARYAGLFDEEDHPRDEHHQKFVAKDKAAGAGSSGPPKPKKKPAAAQEQLFATSDQGTLFGKQAKRVGTLETLQPEKKPDVLPDRTESPLDKDVVKQAEPLAGQKTLTTDAPGEFEIAGLTLEKAGDLAARHGHDKADAMAKIEKRPGAWVGAIKSWQGEERAETSQKRRDTREANWKPTEEQQAVLDAIGSHRVFKGAAQDMLMYSQHKKATEQLIKKGIIDRTDGGREVSYRLLKNTSEAPQSATLPGQKTLEPATEKLTKTEYANLSPDARTDAKIAAAFPKIHAELSGKTPTELKHIGSSEFATTRGMVARDLHFNATAAERAAAIKSSAAPASGWGQIAALNGGKITVAKPNHKTPPAPATQDAIGLITPEGEIRHVRVADARMALHGDHPEFLGVKYRGQGFRYDAASGKVAWNDEPTQEQAEAVHDHLSRKGHAVKAHELLNSSHPLTFPGSFINGESSRYALTDAFDAAFAHYATTALPSPPRSGFGRRTGMGSLRTGSPDTDQKLAAVQGLVNSQPVSSLAQIFKSAMGAVLGQPAKSKQPGGAKPLTPHQQAMQAANLTRAQASAQTAQNRAAASGQPAAPRVPAPLSPAQQAIQAAKVQQAQAGALAAQHKATAAGHGVTTAAAKAQHAQALAQGQQQANQGAQQLLASANQTLNSAMNPAPPTKPHSAHPAHPIGGAGGERPTQGSGKDHWVTIQGTHVLIDGQGNIEKGPAALTGQNVAKLPERKPTPNSDANRQNKPAKPGQPLPGFTDLKQKEGIANAALETPDLTPEQQAIQDQILGGMETSPAAAPPVQPATAQPPAAQPATKPATKPANPPAPRTQAEKDQAQMESNVMWDKIGKRTTSDAPSATPEQQAQIEAQRKAGLDEFADEDRKLAEKKAGGAPAPAAPAPSPAPAPAAPRATPQTPAAASQKGKGENPGMTDRKAYLRGIEKGLMHRREPDAKDKDDLAKVRQQLADMGEAPAEKAAAPAPQPAPAAAKPAAKKDPAPAPHPDAAHHAREIGKAHAEVAAAQTDLADAHAHNAATPEHAQHVAELKAKLQRYEKHIADQEARHTTEKSNIHAGHAPYVADLKRQADEHQKGRAAAEAEVKQLKDDALVAANGGNEMDKKTMAKKRRAKAGREQAVETGRSTKERLAISEAAHDHKVDREHLASAVHASLEKDLPAWHALREAVGTHNQLFQNERKELREGDEDSPTARKMRLDELQNSLESEHGELAHLGVSFKDAFKAIQEGMPPEPSMSDEDYVDQVASELASGNHALSNPEQRGETGHDRGGHGGGGQTGSRGEADDSDINPAPHHHDDDNVPFSLRDRGGPLPHLVAQYARQFQDALDRQFYTRRA